MIADLEGMQSLISADQANVRGCHAPYELWLEASTGKGIECSFNNIQITFEVYQDMYDWMHSNLTWQQWLEQKMTFQPTGRVVESEATVVEALPLLPPKRL